MQKLIPFFFLIISNIFSSQEKLNNKSLGTGFLTSLIPIPIYKNPADKVPFDLISHETAKNSKDFIVVSKIDLKPYNYYPQPYQYEIKFRVIKTTKTYFKVVTNEETWETFYIKRNPKITFYTDNRKFHSDYHSYHEDFTPNPNSYLYEIWEKYLKRVEYIENESIVIYDKPNGKIIFENKNHTFLPFNVIDFNGDWIKLKKGSGREFNFDSNINYEGWTQWKKDDKLLIEITDFTIE